MFFSIISIIFYFIIAETNRVPFDLAEAESELVSVITLNIQQWFCFFLLAEYSNIIPMSGLSVCSFFGGIYRQLI